MIDFKNLPNTNTPLNATNMNKLMQKTTIVTTTDTNLNNYVKEGRYYFSTEYTPTNIPVGANGILEVFEGSGVVKQFWYRHGTINTNDGETYVRTYSDGATWSTWKKFVTEDELLTKATIFASEPMDNTTKTYNLTARHIYLITTGHSISNSASMATVFAHASYGKVNEILSSNNVQYSINNLTLTVTSTNACNISILDVGTY